jgi:hypothetical protein
MTAARIGLSPIILTLSSSASICEITVPVRSVGPFTTRGWVTLGLFRARTGDFGTSPIFEQLSDKLRVRTVLDVKRNGRIDELSVEPFCAA